MAKASPDWSVSGRMSKMTKGATSREAPKLPTKNGTKSVSKCTKGGKVKEKGYDKIPQGNSIIEAAKKSSSAEIDELFDAAEGRKTAAFALLPANVSSTTTTTTSSSYLRPKARSAQTDDGFADTRGARNKARPLTADGLPIFTAEEMKLDQGGDTPNCPFDCTCCY